MCVATSTAIAIATVAVPAAASVYAATKTSGAARDAATTQAGATTHAADLQAEAAKAEEAFKRQQAENDWRTQQQTQKANYDQWAAQRGRMRSLGAMTGIDIGADPAYQPGIDPGFDTGGAPPPGATPGAPPAPNGTPPAPGAATGPIDWTAAPDVLAGQLSAYFKSKGVSDHETPYFVSKAAELVARGKELNDPGYADRRLSEAEVFGGGGKSAPQTQGPMSMAGIVSPLTPAAMPTLAPIAVQPYQQAKRVFSFADMNGGR